MSIHLELMALARQIEHLATTLPAAISHQRSLANQPDSYPVQVPGASPPTAQAWNVNCKPRALDDVKLTAVERAAEQRLHHTRIVADLEAGLRLLKVTTNDLTNDASRYGPGTTVKAVRCSPHGRDGNLVTLADGGWADWNCTAHADKAGLCLRCYARWYRWSKTDNQRSA